MEEEKKNIRERSFDFAVRVIRFVQKFLKNQASNRIGGQLLDAATSVGANVEEATGGFSKRDLRTKWGLL